VFLTEQLTIPVIANGGIETAEDVERCLLVTKADAVMSSEGLLEDPG
jgi:tRNA-dihydrouridine synthase